MLSGIRLSEIVMLLNDEPCPWKAEMCVFKAQLGEPAGSMELLHGGVKLLREKGRKLSL